MAESIATQIVSRRMRRAVGHQKPNAVSSGSIVRSGFPTTRGENFAEKWNAYPERAQAFFLWRERAMADILNLANAQGFDQIAKSLGTMLGESDSRRAFAKYASKKVTEPPAIGKLRSNPITGLGSTGVLVQRNTFYGE